jgi:hypothetical protein
MVNRWSRAAWACIAAATAWGVVGVTPTMTAGAGGAGPPGRIVLVQAVPNDAIDVSVDGRTVARGSTVGSVLGPITVSPGQHVVRFSDGSGRVSLTSSVDVRPGSSSDIVVHLPAAVGGAPVVSSYPTPRAPIGPGKARVLVAHTATVAPADVRVDGQVVFRDIANGEFATADVAAGSHRVALLPAGLAGPPILGPLTVDLAPGTVTMVYAVGNPRNGSMKVIAHTARITSNGAVVPDRIDTGNAGLVSGVVARAFRIPPPTR